MESATYWILNKKMLRARLKKIDIYYKINWSIWRLGIRVLIIIRDEK